MKTSTPSLRLIASSSPFHASVADVNETMGSWTDAALASARKAIAESGLGSDQIDGIIQIVDNDTPIIDIATFRRGLEITAPGRPIVQPIPSIFGLVNAIQSLISIVHWGDLHTFIVIQSVPRPGGQTPTAAACIVERASPLDGWTIETQSVLPLMPDRSVEETVADAIDEITEGATPADPGIDDGVYYHQGSNGIFRALGNRALDGIPFRLRQGPLPSTLDVLCSLASGRAAGGGISRRRRLFIEESAQSIHALVMSF